MEHMKRIFICVFTVILISAVLLSGMLAARKLHSMYKNIWDTLDELTDASKRVSSLTEEIIKDTDFLSKKVDHLHRKAFISDDPQGSLYDYSWMESVPPYIAHACGGIDDRTYTNSREAFLLNYELGQRVFEIDFNLTEDGKLIASHTEWDWRRMTGTDLPYTSENFDQLALHGEYETLDCAEVIDLMAAHPDMYLVTDTKDQTQDKVMLGFAQLVHCAKQRHPEVLDRIIPQIYNEDMLTWISSIYPFRSVIFTLYAAVWSPESVLNFCLNSGIRFITIPSVVASEELISLWDTLGIHVAVHTVNDESEIASFFDMGVDMIYTDFATPN